jgi:hypothetical protein
VHGGVLGAFLELTALLHLIDDSGSERVPKPITFSVDYLRSAGPATTGRAPRSSSSDAASRTSASSRGRTTGAGPWSRERQVPARVTALVRYRSLVADSARWEGFGLRPGDIVISTPPKCGTTWTQMLCALLIFDGPRSPRRSTSCRRARHVQPAARGSPREARGPEHRRFSARRTRRSTECPSATTSRTSWSAAIRATSSCPWTTTSRTWTSTISSPPRARHGNRWPRGVRAAGAERGSGRALPGVHALGAVGGAVRTRGDRPSSHDRVDTPPSTQRPPAALRRHDGGPVGELLRLAVALEIPLDRARAVELAAEAGSTACGRARPSSRRLPRRRTGRTRARSFRRGGFGEWRTWIGDEDAAEYERRVAALAPPDLARGCTSGASSPDRR